MTTELDNFFRKYDDVLIEPSPQDTKRKILIVDDEKRIGESLNTILKNQYNVVLVLSGEEAIEAVGEEVHCIIMDAKMPGMDGFAATTIIKKQYPNIPVIMHTAYHDEHNTADVVDCQFYGYIEKGNIDVRDLKYKIKQAVDSYSLYLEKEKFKTDLEIKLVELENAYHEIKLQKINRRLLKNSNNELEASYRMAEQANIAKTNFLANMSHEIRTPLNVVLAMAELLGETGLNQKQNDYLHSLRHSGKQLLDILNNILEFSRIDSGAVSIDKEPFTLGYLIDNIELMAAPMARAKGLEFNIVNGVYLEKSRLGDVAKIQQIVLNLLNNAIKYTNTGFIRLHIAEAHLKDGEDGVRFDVIDSGIGIPEEMQTRIFERFTQTNLSLPQKAGGVGLGLAICRKLVHMMDGSVSLSSTVGAGSTFTVTIPLPFTEEQSCYRHNTEDVLLSREVFGPTSIMVAEDVVENYFIIKHFLRDYPFTLSHAINGADAIRQLEKNTFDLVLMDIGMPVMDGVEAMKIIKKGVKPPPVIAVTSNAFDEQKKFYINSGFNHVMAKPFSKKVLLQIIYRYTVSEIPIERNDYEMNRLRIDTPSRSKANLIVQVIQRLHNDFADLSHALQSRDKTRMRDMCHAVRGMAGLYGLHGIATTIKDFSESVKKDDIERAGELLEILQESVKKIELDYLDR